MSSSSPSHHHHHHVITITNNIITIRTPPPQHHRHHLPTTVAIPTIGALGFSTQKGCVWFSEAPKGACGFSCTKRAAFEVVEDELGRGAVG
ncbi:hypothetical protein Tco_0439333 [Tanacetum coccineum]